MSKLYIVFIFALLSTSLYSQSPVKAVEMRDARFRFINKTTGTAVNDLLWDEAESFVNGFAKVASNHKWGFVDLYGNVAIRAEYESVRNFYNHLAAVRQNSMWGFIDEQGKTVISFEFDIIFDFKENVTAGYKGNKWYLLNKQGNIIRSLDIDIFYGFKNGKAKFSKNGRTGSMNLNGDIIFIEPEKTTAAKRNNTANARTSTAQAGDCPANIGFEDGNFTNWSCYVGDVAANGTTNVITVNPSAPTANRHVIYPRSNPSAIDPYGLFPINPPDGSGYALKLGNNVNGAEAERVSYQINVPANSADASITYRYAVVFQDPGHLTYQQPRFSAKVLDVLTNTYLDCASYEYVSTSSLPGFNTSPVDDSVKYKTWASVFINLSAYAGRTLILEFTTADCTRGAHWGYAYVDVGDCNITADIQYQCNPSMATLSGPPGFEFYNWWNSDFSSILGTGQVTTLTPAPQLNATLHVEVIPFNGFGCSDTLEVVVTNSNPTANAGSDKSMCPGLSTVIGSPAISGNIYSWSPATYLSNPNIAAPVSTTPVSATYIVTVSNIANGCTDTDTVNIFVAPKPLPVFDPGPPQCLVGNSFTFFNTSVAGASYSWNFGDGNTSAASSPVHSYTSATTYNAKLVVTGSNGCKDSITHPVTVHPHPVITTSNDLSICRGNSVQLSTSGGQSYQWTPSAGLSCSNCTGPAASPLTNATYIVSGTNSFGCPASDTVNITVHQPIQVNVSPDRTICDRDSIPLAANGAVSYAWSPAQGLSSVNTPNTVAAPNTSTQYRVIGFDGHNCFTDTGFINITVNPKPSVELGPDLTLSTGTIHTFTPVTQNGPIVWWQWSPATNLNCTNCSEPSATVKKDITYHASVRNIYGCMATDSVRIKTFCENSQVFIPNAFTPDGDGVNDILMVRAKGIEMVRSFRIFSRWGELLFEKTNFPPNTPTYGWDGKIKGVTGAPEVYVYTAEVTCDNLQTYTYKGNVSILR
ncbi:MAG: WG repeat-containing protein [Chitinophagaceae bacterium]|nr:WG repeat-containing protein [Chitinophagaceae bacterium]